MAEAVVLLIFAILLLGCVVTGVSVVYALGGGLVCFCIYTRYCGYSMRQLGSMVWQGIWNSRTILRIFVLIGFLTALWRASGTIPSIVYYSAASMVPRYYLLLTFLLCCGMSMLTGTSFGTVSTMGVICASIGRAIGIPPAYIGGAVMSGIYFGEQCSPLSSSALLICDLTETDIYANIVQVFRVVLVPFAATAIWYLCLGSGISAHAAAAADTELFRQSFDLGGIVLLPAILIIILGILRIQVEQIMMISIISAAAICVSVQGMSLKEVAEAMINGYHVAMPELAVLIDGGGLKSMAELGVIVAISSSYFGIFSSTGLLTRLKQQVAALAAGSSVYIATIIVSVATCAVSCNQTLASMLTCELTRTLVQSRQELAINLETSVIVIAGLIPWSIACAFPLAAVSAPAESLAYAFYLYAVPGWMLVRSILLKK